MQDLARDGVRLAYTELGRGAPPLLFVHELGGDHTHFAPQVAHFAQRHRVVAVDLRGHGASDAPAEEYTLAGFAADLAWLCSALGLYKPVIVGHGLGGLIALELAARYPEQPGALVLLDALRLPMPHDTLSSFMANAFAPVPDPGRKAHLLVQVNRLSPHLDLACWRLKFGDSDDLVPLPTCRLPILSLSATPPSDQSWLAQRCPALHIGQTVGAGHWQQLDVPDQVNAMLGRFLALLATNPELMTQDSKQRPTGQK